MPANLQLATTLVAPTGTGKLFEPFMTDANRIQWKQSTTSANFSAPHVLQTARVLPKSTPTFPGVERSSLKLTAKCLVNGVERILVGTIDFSIPADVGTTVRTDFVTDVALLARDALATAMATKQQISN